MSDTEAKIAKRREEAKKAQQRNKRREASNVNPYRLKKAGGIAITAVCVLLIVGFILANLGVSKRVVTAMRVGKERINSAEFSYYYNNAYQQYYQNMYYYVIYGLISDTGIDPNTSLKKQVIDKTTGKTYAEYFEEQAIDNIQEIYTLYQEAVKAGYTLSEEDAKEINDSIESLTKDVKDGGYSSLNQYLKHAYGLGFTEKLYRKAQEIYAVAAAYSVDKAETFQYEVSDLTKYYEDNRKDFDTLTVRYYKFNVQSGSEKTTEQLLAEARTMAEEFMSGVDSEEAYAAKALAKAKEASSDPDSVTTESTKRENTSYAALLSVNEALAEWACDASRKAGDTAVLDAGNETGYYAVYMVTPTHLDTYNTVDVRHILIEVEAVDSKITDETEKATAKENNEKAAKLKADQILAEWKAGAATEDSFAALAKENTADSNGEEGGLYEKIYKGQTVTEFNDWCFDPARQAGDTEVIKTDYGYHVMYFVGENIPYWQMDVEEVMRSNDYTDYVDGVKAELGMKTFPFGIAFRTEPIK